jgi:hypothetical protein
MEDLRWGGRRRRERDDNCAIDGDERVKDKDLAGLVAWHLIASAAPIHGPWNDAVGSAEVWIGFLICFSLRAQITGPE